jgi:hypothetical protein
MADNDMAFNHFPNLCIIAIFYFQHPCNSEATTESIMRLRLIGWKKSNEDPYLKLK